MIWGTWFYLSLKRRLLESSRNEQNVNGINDMNISGPDSLFKHTSIATDVDFLEVLLVGVIHSTGFLYEFDLVLRLFDYSEVFQSSSRPKIGYE